MAKGQSASKGSAGLPYGKGHPALERILGVLLESSEDGVLVFDRQMRVLFMNSVCERLTGQSRDLVIRGPHTCSELMGCHDQYGQSSTPAEGGHLTA